MSKPNGVAHAQFDEMGLEFPFSESNQGETGADSEGALDRSLETPFAESSFDEATIAESALELTPDETEAWSEAEPEGEEEEEEEAPLAEGEDEAFPSGLSLQPATGATGKGEEHWDPQQTGIPLLATGPDVQGQRVSAHFTVRELVTSGGRAASVARISPELVRVLEAIRVRAGKTVRITSGYRSWARNKAVYAARNKKPTDSRHCSGQAADISVSGMSGTDLAKLAIDAAGTNLGIGIARSFIHVDVRGSWAIWTYFPTSSEEHKTAIAAVVAHRARALRGAGPAPQTSPRPSAPSPSPMSASGPSGRLVVTKHPMLRSHRGTPPDLILRWHRITQPGDIDVVLHFHGYGHTNQQAAVRIDLHKERVSGLDFSNPAAPATGGRARPTVAILPRGHYFVGKNKNGYSFPALTPRGELQKLIADALARVSKATGHELRMGRFILTGHSGGGAPLTAVLAHTDPDEVHVFDGLYGSSAAIGAWAEKRIARELSSPGPLPPALRVLYRPGSTQYPGTQPQSEALARQISPALSAAGAERLGPFFRVEMTRVDHNAIPAMFGWRLLANAGGDLPETTRYSGAPRATREAAFNAEEFALEADGQNDEGFEAEGYEAESEQSERLAWLDVEALAAEAGESTYEGALAETYEREGQEGEWLEAEDAAEHEHALGVAELGEEEGEADSDNEESGDRFDSFEDERDTEWDLTEQELLEEESTLAGSGLTTAEQKAVEITSQFETGKRGGFYGLSGNFDGQGLSFGLVNWTIGTGSLQPLLRDFAREHPRGWVAAFGPHAAEFLKVITPVGKAAEKDQHRFAVDVMNSVTIVKGAKRWAIKEPWVTYFKRLSEDRDFQQIQVRYVRNLLERGEYFCRYFKLRSEMSFAFMFDTVSSHGKWWLTKKFNGQEKRRLLVEQRLTALVAHHGVGKVPESDILLAIADVLAATSAARWAANVRRRKRWFLTGEHPRAKELKGLEPRPNVPYTSSGATPVARSPASRPGGAPRPAPPSVVRVPTTGDLGATIAQVAEAEFRRWHPASGNLRETHAAAVPILQQYYREGFEREVSAADLQSETWQRSHPWSAVFISWVMIRAGASVFPKSAAHQGYVRVARRNRLNGVTSNPFWAYRATEAVPQVGDLICRSRSNSGATYDNIGDAQTRPTHCDIVTEVRPGSLRVIGGNANQNVDARTRRTLPSGHLALDGEQSGYFAVVRCRGAISS